MTIAPLQHLAQTKQIGLLVFVMCPKQNARDFMMYAYEATVRRLIKLHPSTFWLLYLGPKSTSGSYSIICVLLVLLAVHEVGRQFPRSANLYLREIVRERERGVLAMLTYTVKQQQCCSLSCRAVLPLLRQRFYNPFLSDFSRAFPSRRRLLRSEPLIAKDLLYILPLAGMPTLFWQYNQTPTHGPGSNGDRRSPGRTSQWW